MSKVITLLCAHTVGQPPSAIQPSAALPPCQDAVESEKLAAGH
ncbi:MAG: hypothetical protein WCA13_11510 [Terriglobales bacterium]